MCLLCFDAGTAQPKSKLVPDYAALADLARCPALRTLDLT